MREEFTEPAAKLVEEAHELFVSEPGRDGTPAKFGNYTSDQLQGQFTFLLKAFRDKLDIPEKDAIRMVRTLLSQGESVIPKTEPLPVPLVPKGYEVTSELRGLDKKIHDAENRFNLRNGQFRPNTPEEKLFAFNEKIRSLEKSAKTYVDARALSTIHQNIAILEEAKAALLKLEEIKQARYESFYALNPPRDFPYGFTSKENFADFGHQFRNRLRESLTHPGDTSIKVELGGSATDGLSFIEKDEGILRRPFGRRSDLDFVVTLPKKEFDQIFPSTALALQADYIQNGGAQSYPIDAQSLRTYLNKHPEIKGPVLNLPHLLDKQSELVGGRHISLLFNTDPTWNQSRPGRFLSVGE